MASYFDLDESTTQAVNTLRAIIRQAESIYAILRPGNRLTTNSVKQIDIALAYAYSKNAIQHYGCRYYEVALAIIIANGNIGGPTYFRELLNVVRAHGNNLGGLDPNLRFDSFLVMRDLVDARDTLFSLHHMLSVKEAGEMVEHVFHHNREIAAPYGALVKEKGQVTIQEVYHDIVRNIGSVIHDNTAYGNFCNLLYGMFLGKFNWDLRYFIPAQHTIEVDIFKHQVAQAALDAQLGDDFTKVMKFVMDSDFLRQGL